MPVSEHRRKRVRKGTKSCWEYKGTRCLSQEYVDDQSARDDGNSALNQRMGNVETLLQKLMEKVSQAAGFNSTVQGPDNGTTSSPAPATSYDLLAPFLVSNEDVLGMETEISTSVPQSKSVSESDTLGSGSSPSPIGRIEKLRRRLAAMLPCQEDVNHLSDLSRGFWLIRRHMMPYLLALPECDFQEKFDVAAVSMGHPMVIARLLLCVALCIQQLPPDIDPRRLQTKMPLREMIEEIITFVTAAVTSDDELIGNMEGIECLERYLSLILGVPSATGSAPFPFDERASWLTTEDLYNKNLCQIAGLILARNQGDITRAYSVTQEIDEQLNSLAKRMPHAWWEIPISLVADHTEEAATQLERLMCQIWHFELQTLVHLPFMLRAATDRRYEYSRVSCLSACRGLMKAWMSMREVHAMTFVSNLLEFQAFTAAVTLLLGLLGPPRTTTDPVALKEQNEDLQLVETVVQILEGLKRCGTGVQVVNQSISAIRSLQDVLQNEGPSSGNLRLSIPHFGTIMVASGKAVKSLEGERILGANPCSDGMTMEANPPPLHPVPSQSTYPGTGSASTWTSIPASSVQQYPSCNDGGESMNSADAWIKNTVLHFTSSQFPTFDEPAMEPTAEWPLYESDTVLYDSLLNADVDGHWNF
ncbi:hypothetical protein LTR85_001358 [Meristemomyces frigidus]|nr:hypothetical protein LTR85_001358 [Meristemomyces frigidus]